MRTCLAAFLCLALATPAPAEDLPALYDVQGVAAGDVLTLRAEPDAGAQALGGLAPEARGIEVVALSADGMWAQVGQGEFGGWVALEQLARQPGQSPWWQMQGPLRCLGTEPFWTLALPDGSAQGTFTTPDPPALDMQMQAVWPGQDWLHEAGITLSGGGATATLLIRGAACSDGMSDRTYGLAATLLLVGAPIGGGVPLPGCCTLSVP